MYTRDRRSQRIRDQIRAHANPRSGQAVPPRSLQEQLKRVYGGENGAQFQPDPVARDLARIARRRR